ncbi:MAG TPA: replication/maintenance protein RepL, partial [Niabella sp.]|nr:replication/maintenance protein RepL [Niabella sp.]
MKKRISQEVTHTKTDLNGEVIEEVKNQVAYIEREPDYVKLYISDILRLQDIPKSGNDILLAVIKRMTYNNDIALFAPVKREIASELGIKEVTVSKAIELFTNKSILLRKDRGLYLINPFFFGRGKWEEIRKVRLQVIYSEEGRMILKTEFETV